MPFSIYYSRVIEIGGIMAKEKDMKCNNWHGSCGPSGAVYGLGVIGAAVYFIQQAPSFWAGVVGLLKALVWPAFLVYDALKFLGL